MGLETTIRPGRAKMDASKSAFAQRMMDKPMPESLNSDPDARFFYDPPELIQIAFGGRTWFHDVGNLCVHRVGNFRGLGWSLSALIAEQDERGINAVIISARAPHAGKPQLYDILYIHREIVDGEVRQRTIHHTPGLEAHELKPAYAATLGEHAI